MDIFFLGILRKYHLSIMVFVNEHILMEVVRPQVLGPLE